MFLLVQALQSLLLFPAGQEPGLAQQVLEQVLERGPGLVAHLQGGSLRQLSDLLQQALTNPLMEPEQEQPQDQYCPQAYYQELFQQPAYCLLDQPLKPCPVWGPQTTLFR